MTASDFERRHFPSSFGQLVFSNPTDFDDLKTYAERRRYGHLLFYGPNGSAKSTTAELIVRERQGLVPAANILVERFGARELNSNLDPIISRISLLVSPFFVGDERPYVIIEEVDQMTTNTQYDLRMLMDTLTVGKVIMTTNNFEGVDRGIRDRSEKFELLHPSPQQWLPRAQSIMAAEGFTVSDTALLSVLSAASHGGGNPTIREMMRALDELSVALRGTAGTRTPVSSSRTAAITSRRK